MPKRHAAGQPQPQPPKEPQPAAWSPAVKLVLSALIAFHVTAVFVPPFTFACGGGRLASPLAEAVYGWFRPYVGPLYLDHGYFFFAPDPGPSHLVDYRVEFDDGRAPVMGRFPDLKTQRPRLLYHRHFMLAESLNNRFVPPDPPPEPSPPPLTATAGQKRLYQITHEIYGDQLKRWQHARRQYEAMQQSMAEHLKAKHGGQRVTLTRVEHRLLSADEFQYGDRRIDDPDLFVNLPETTPTNVGR